MKILKLLNHSKKWIKGSIARNKEGHPVFLGSHPDAVSWCLIGALEKCYGSAYNAQSKKLEQVIAKMHPQFCGNIVGFNNASTTTFRKLRNLLRKANV